MSTAKKKAVQPAAKGSELVPSRPGRTKSRKASVVVIDGVEITLLRPAGKGTLKRADIVKAVKKVVAARHRTESGGANDVQGK